MEFNDTNLFAQEYRYRKGAVCIFSVLIVLGTDFSNHHRVTIHASAQISCFLFLYFVHFVMNRAEYNLLHWDANVNNRRHLLLQTGLQCSRAV